MATVSAPGASIALDRDTVLVDFDIDAALAFLIIKIACHDQADGEYNDHGKKQIAG